MGKDFIIYLTKRQTGLPFDIEKDDHFQSYRAAHPNGMREILSISDVINIHLLMELKKKIMKHGKR